VPSWLIHSGQFSHKVVTMPTIDRAQSMDKVRWPKTDILTTELRR